MSRVVLITTEPVPLEGWPTTGAGLRAWGIAQALRGRGHEVALLMPEDALAGFTPPKGAAAPTRDLPDWVGTFRRGELEGHERLKGCDAIVLQHWGVARDLGATEAPLAIDLAGPHLLERRLWGSGADEADLAEKLAALRRADFVTVGGARQRFYFSPFLNMAGWDPDDQGSIPVIPFSLKADPEPSPVVSDRFICAGFLLPWQDPAGAIEVVLEELLAAERGELIFIGGAHPHADVSLGKFERLLDRIRAHPRAQCLGAMSYDDFLGHLRGGGVALDLMALNPERELAFTTRTVQFMACGLPVIHDNYSELGERIESAGAGWTFDPEDRNGLRGLARKLLNGEIDPGAQSRAAHRLVADELDWDRTIEPLDRFCRDPHERAGKTAADLVFERRQHELADTRSELQAVRSRLDTLLGKRWVRWGLHLFSRRGAVALPAAALAALAGVLLIPIFWLNDKFGK